MKKIVSFVLCCIAGLWANAQQVTDSTLIQFSGYVVNHDSARVIPFATVRIEGTGRGVYADQTGFFSIVAQKKDKVVFSSIGMKTTRFVFPKDLSETRFFGAIRMEDDTFYLPEYVVRPYNTPEEFDYYFLKSRVKGNNLALAYGNIAQSRMNDFSKTLSIDGGEAYRYYQQDQYSKYYYNGQAQPIRIFDAFAWQEFISSLNKKKKK